MAAAGFAGYTVYNQKTEEKAFEEKMAQTISSLPPIVVYEKAELPSIEEEFEGTSDMIDIGSVTPDISNVYTTEPDEYEVIYTFRDVNGVQRTATVPCTVKPDLTLHVTGMQDISIDEGDPLPTETNCTFDDYVASVTLDTSAVNASVPGKYDISYTILGKEGEMQTADGYTCTVNAAAPLPTPTPTQAPKPTAVPKPTATPKPVKTKQTKPKVLEPAAVGNVQEPEVSVQTGDSNNILLLVVLIVVSIGAVIGAVVYRRFKRTRR